MSNEEYVHEQLAAQKRVAFFPTCLVQAFYPSVQEAAYEVMLKYHTQVDIIKDVACCGQPALNSGYIDEAREMARSLLDLLDQYDLIVLPSGSCAGMIRHHYPQLLAEELDDVQSMKISKLSEKIIEWSAHIIEQRNAVKKENLGLFSAKDEKIEYDKNVKTSDPFEKVTYHASCHALRLYGLEDQPERIIQSIPGIKYVPLSHAEVCCGFGGTFSVKMSELSLAMAEEKLTHVLETGANILVSTDVGCLMHLEGYSRSKAYPLKMMHIAELYQYYDKKEKIVQTQYDDQDDKHLELEGRIKE